MAQSKMDLFLASVLPPLFEVATVVVDGPAVVVAGLALLVDILQEDCWAWTAAVLQVSQCQIPPLYANCTCLPITAY